jgi:2-methylisocitrate lyase-like PEP mutase family enzyme
MRTIAEKRKAFRQLHQSGCFVLPNPWDVGSARFLEHLGFVALASTSTGFAWTQGRADYALERAIVLRHLSLLASATNLPVNADFESGFGETPEAVGEAVAMAVVSGVAGLSIEDRIVGDLERLYPTNQAVERLQAARRAIDSSGQDVVLVGRTEGLLVGGDAKSAIDKLVALADAGADCLYAPGLSKPEDIKSLVQAVAPKSVNILIVDPHMSLKALAGLGVRRVSLGGGLALVGWGAINAAAKAIKDGDFTSLANGMDGAALNVVFAGRNK